MFVCIESYTYCLYHKCLYGCARCHYDHVVIFLKTHFFNFNHFPSNYVLKSCFPVSCHNTKKKINNICIFAAFLMPYRYHVTVNVTSDQSKTSFQPLRPAHFTTSCCGSCRSTNLNSVPHCHLLAITYWPYVACSLIIILLVCL